VVSLERARPRLSDLALAAAEVAVVAAIAVAYGTDGPASTVAALVLAPVAVLLTRRLGEKLAGPRYGLVSALVYIGLPLLGRAYVLSTYRPTFAHHVVPQLVGLRATPWFALGVGLAALALVRVAWVLFVVAALISLALGTNDLHGVRDGLHETAWSVSLLPWLAAAGVVGAAGRSLALAATLAGWLVLIALHGARQGYADAAFWQSLSAAAPAIAVTLTSLGLLVPPLRRAAPAPAEPHAL
jgi:hypothetical protein